MELIDPILGEIKITDTNLHHLIYKLYLKPDKDKPNHFLNNTENSFRTYNNSKLDFFKINLEISKKTENNKVISRIIKTSDIKSEILEKSYKYCLILGKQYEETISMKVEIYKKIITKKGTEIQLESSFINDIKIPLYVCHSGGTSSNVYISPEPLETGGYFICKNNLKKIIVFKQDRTYTWPKYKLQKINFHHASFSNIPLRFIDRYVNPQFLVFDMDLNKNKSYISISSKKTLPSINIILLISFLTKLTLTDLKKILIEKFKFNNIYFDKNILNIIEIIFEISQIILNKHNPNNESEAIKNYIYDYILNHQRLNPTLSSTEIYNEIFIKNLLPSINNFRTLFLNESISYSNTEIVYLKGMTLFVEFENFLIASFQNQIYPSKDNFTVRRITSPGSSYENITNDAMKNLINDLKEQIDKQIKNSSNITVTVKPFRKSENAFNTIFNMQDNKQSNIVKPFNNINAGQVLFVNNLVVLESQLNLTNYVPIKNPNLFSWQFLGPVDTPDHGEKVGINRRLNIGIKINDKDLITHKKLFIEIVKFIRKYIKENIINGVNVVIIDDSPIYIGTIEQTKALKFYNEFIKTKRLGIFIDNYIDISLIPNYQTTNSKIFLPTNTYRMIRINIGNRITFMPMFIVEKGELAFKKYKFQPQDFISFDNLCKKYEIIEFIGPEQFAYSNICENVETFNNLSLEVKKKYNYVSLPNAINLSIIESMIFDISKMPGTRGIFAVSQLKNSVSSIPSYSFNNIETSKFSSFGFQEPCITNSALIESKISKQSFGTHILVAFMSNNYNIEDSVIINKSSVDAGLFLMINVLLYKGETDSNKLQNTDNIINKKKNSYRKLEDNGIPAIDTVMEMGDALYGNTEARIKKTNTNMFYLHDTSQPYKYILPGRVDRILFSSNENEISIRYTVFVHHYAERGHKLSNLCAQKATISKLATIEELPYNSHGVRPDLIYNSVSLISRKTLNMYILLLMTNLYSYIPYGKSGIKEYINYDSFSNIDYNILCKLKKKLKQNYPNFTDEQIDDIFNCKEKLFNPYTCEPIESQIFMGPIYFTRLSQISEEKIAVRNRGKLNKFNQPPAGKKKGGSHKLGEMEIDVLATHGCTNILYEVSKDSIESQQYTLICTNCSNIATIVKTNSGHRYTCLNCENIGFTPDFERHMLSKTTKILLGLLNFRGIKLKIKYQENNILYREDLR